jgi:peptide/nickel transport system ATP-binding protein
VSALLQLSNFTVQLPTASGWVKPVNEVSLEIAQGEALGLVGESGSGKTMPSLALMGLLPPGARITGDAQLFTREQTAVSLSHQTDDLWRSIRGQEIAMIFQEPMTSLNPVMRVGAQIAEAILAHEPKLKPDLVHKRLLNAMQQAAIPDPETRARQFPHQLSGGLRQRVMIAMALAPSPRLLIADEPTTALDVTVQAQILLLLKALQQRNGLGMLFISHDLAVVAQIADRVAVMRRGMLLETGSRDQVFLHPRHAYTKSLLGAVPTLTTDRDQPLATLAAAAENATGTLVEEAPGHWVRCVQPV